MNKKLCRNGIFFKEDGQEGFVLVIALLVIVVLTVIGVSATRNTAIELQIAGNDRIYAGNFYRSEAKVFEAGQRLANAKAADLNSNQLDIDGDGTLDGVNNGLVAKADIAGSYDPDEVNLVNYLETYGNTNGADRFLAVNLGKVGSIKMNNGTSMYAFDVYGQSVTGNSSKIIKIGYLKAF
ncbi:MAG: PilX N-terminal domain-containing pilus assembly protein [Desulfotalea sp.]